MDANKSKRLYLTIAASIFCFGTVAMLLTSNFGKTIIWERTVDTEHGQLYLSEQFDDDAVQEHLVIQLVKPIIGNFRKVLSSVVVTEEVGQLKQLNVDTDSIQILGAKGDIKLLVTKDKKLSPITTATAY
jgi:hypothetical protein